MLRPGSRHGVAAAAAAAATDPPAPEPNYREPVTVVPLPGTRWPHELTTPEQLEALRSLLETAARIFALENARTLTRARLMSARIFGDGGAADQQWRGYLKIEREMIEAADELERILPEVEKQIEASGFFDPEKMSAWLDALAQEGFSAAMYETMSKAGLDATQINQLAALKVHRPLIEFVKVAGLLVKPFVVNLQQFVQEIQKERETVLAGEDVHSDASGNRSDLRRGFLSRSRSPLATLPEVPMTNRRKVGRFTFRLYGILDIRFTLSYIARFLVDRANAGGIRCSLS